MKPSPKLFAVVVDNVYPTQCVVVWQREASALALAKHLNKTLPQGVVKVRPVDEFYPGGMAGADPAWLIATDKYLQGCHHNTSG